MKTVPEFSFQLASVAVKNNIQRKLPPLLYVQQLYGSAPCFTQFATMILPAAHTCLVKRHLAMFELSESRGQYPGKMGAVLNGNAGIGLAPTVRCSGNGW
ncbi:hypothetical protein [Mangrovibacter yixingensis]|uniref:hypothetical protein n=1 Tax=Mangrovibacter yixingensis TaxID=1529639 RepID=UPI001CF9FA3C|nr:hypothetical protein [Mangrovibacter yixingensis]